MMKPVQLTFKHKFGLWLLIAAIFGIVLFSRLLVPIIHQCAELNELTLELQNKKLEFSSLKQAERKLLLTGAHTEESEQSFLQGIQDFCTQKQLTITQINAPLREKSQNYQRVTTTFYVQGSFQSVVQLLFFCESKFTTYKVRSCNFYIQKIKGGDNQLICEIYVQHVI